MKDPTSTLSFSITVCVPILALYHPSSSFLSVETPHILSLTPIQSPYNTLPHTTSYTSPHLSCPCPVEVTLTDMGRKTVGNDLDNASIQFRNMRYCAVCVMCVSCIVSVRASAHLLSIRVPFCHSMLCCSILFYSTILFH